MKGQWTGTHFSHELSNSDPLEDIITATSVTTEKWVFVVGGLISVLEPAQGGGGRFQLRSTDGEDILIDMDANAVKDVPFYYGDPGARLSTKGQGLQVIVYGAGSNQATVRVSLVAHVGRRAE